MTVASLAKLREPVGDGALAIASIELGGMAVTSMHFRSEVDVTPVLEAALGESLCPVPHWFVVLAGAIHARYTDGTAETAKAGDVLYMPPGHTATNEAGTECIELSAAEPNAYVMGRIMATGMLG